MSLEIDILEDHIANISADLLAKLLEDHTRSTETNRVNIFWATDDYKELGPHYQYGAQITPELITGKNGHVIMPRVLKSRTAQSARTTGMAEVFTPAWVCNKQNNVIDAAWFGREGAFNTEIDGADGSRTWRTNREKIVFPEGKTWRDYVRDTRLEITCGEAPYIVSRYDVTTGEAIPLEERIGLLDRKLRVVGENTETTAEWLEWAQVALKSTYAYEWQGDNLLIAREAVLFSYIEYFEQKFGRQPKKESLIFAAYIISWNMFQMDGLKGVVPNSCHEEYALFGNTVCPGCQHDLIDKHNGTYCIIRDWAKPRNRQKMRFIDVLKTKKE